MQSFARWTITGLFFAYGVANAQFGREATWMTAGRDAQRTSWVKSDLSITIDTVPEFQYLWKVQLGNSKAAAGEPMVMDRYIGYRGFRSLAFMEDGGGGMYAVDTDLNRIEWQKHFASIEQVSSSNCDGELTGTVTLPTNAAFPVSLGGRIGRGEPAKSDVGEPFEGAVTIKTPPAPPFRFPAPTVRPGAQRSRPPIVIYSVTGDGMLHTMYVSNGEEPEPAVRFLPAGSNLRGFIVLDDVAYAVAGKKCEAPDEVVAMNLSTKDTLSWRPDGATIAGLEGIAFGPDGTLYAGTGKGNSTYASSVVALDPTTLKPKDWFSATGADFASTPIVFQYKNKVVVAAATKNGGIYVLDAKSLGGADHQTAMAKAEGKNVKPVALAVWEDARLTHWLLASNEDSHGGITAWKVTDDEHGAPVLEQGWISSSISKPSTPLIINGVVFAASRGQGKSTVYAMDAATGQELWSSKGSVESPIEALSGGGGHVFATTSDGALYAFGFPMEH